MPEPVQIPSQWLQTLFSNDLFKIKLKEFVTNCDQNQRNKSSYKFQKQINSISDQITQEIFNQIEKLTLIKYDVVMDQVNKINREIINLKNTVFQNNQKIDLQVTSYNKSKLQFSSILQQDIGSDITEFKSTIQQLKEKFNQLFVGSQPISKNTFIIQNLNQSPISKFINKKCNQAIVSSQKKQIKRIEATQLIIQKRIQQISKTLNNVLQMLNESNSKKLDSSKECQNQQPVKSTNQPTLLRQSSLQNLKIKNFFTFGNK